MIGAAVAEGWTVARACGVLQVDPRRVRDWQRRAAVDQLEDRPPGGSPVHGLLPEEVDEVLAVADEWSDVDRSHRKLAHRGSYLQRVWVSPSTVLRILNAHGRVLPARPPRPTPAPGPWPPPEVPWEPNRIWMYDLTEFTRAGRICVAIVDVVSRRWITHLLTADESASIIRVAFENAIDTESLWDRIEAHLDDHPVDDPAEERLPVLLACSDRGPQMTAASTRQFLALWRIAQRLGRPATPTDQAWVESFFGHLKGEHPHLELITDPAALDTELGRIRRFYNQVRLHAGIGYVTPNDEHHGRGPHIRRARQQGMTQARHKRLAYHRAHRNEPPS